MFELREISSFAPASDIVMSIVLIAISALIANLVVVPKLSSHPSFAGRFLLAASAAGILAVVVVLAIWPNHFLSAVAHYIVGFSALALILIWTTMGRRLALERVLIAAACMSLAYYVGVFLVELPR